MNLKGRTALVTGASSGIGEHLARQLAARGANLVITARRADRLEKLAAELRAAHAVAVEVIALDLAEPSAPARLFDATEGAGRPIDVLANNAGIGTQADFLTIPWERSREQLSLNVVSLTELTWRFTQAMKTRGAGWVLNVASIGAYLPIPTFATYAAGKAYVKSFTEALAYELRKTGVRLTCLCPGPTATEFIDVAGQQVNALTRLYLMTPERCARVGLRNLFWGRPNVVSGLVNKLVMWLTRFTPQWLLVRIAAVVMK